jgi:chitin synthase
MALLLLPSYVVLNPIVSLIDPENLFQYALVHFGLFYKSSHGIIRKFFLHIQALVSKSLDHPRRITERVLQLQYNLFYLIFSWFALANLWLTFSIIIDLLPNQSIYIFGTAAVVSFLNLLKSCDTHINLC